MVECIFCKIINKTVPSEIILETSDILVIKDINPKADIHYLIIPKKHIENIQAIKKEDNSINEKMISIAQDLYSKLKQDFRLIINNGFNAGQRVFHLHIHYLSGKSVKEF